MKPAYLTDTPCLCEAFFPMSFPSLSSHNSLLSQELDTKRLHEFSHSVSYDSLAVYLLSDGHEDWKNDRAIALFEPLTLLPRNDEVINKYFVSPTRLQICRTY